jgi:hypothetical protein
MFASTPFSLLQHPIEPYWREIQHKSGWEGSGEYQCGDDNPQFELTIPDAATTPLLSSITSSDEGRTAVTVSHRTLLTMSVNQDSEYSIIMFICCPKGGQRYVGCIEENDIIMKSKYLTSKSVTLNTSLPCGTYTVVCCLQPEGSTSACRMSFWCARTNFFVKELPVWPKRTLTAEWKNSGLYQSAERHPQFRLTVTEPARLVIKLNVSLCSDPAITFFVVDNTRNTGHCWKGHIHDANIVAQAPYIRSDSVSLQ